MNLSVSLKNNVEDTVDSYIYHATNGTFGFASWLRGLSSATVNVEIALPATKDIARPPTVVKDRLTSGYGRARAKAVSNWIIVEMGRLLNLNGMEIGESRVTPAHMVELVELIDSGTVSTSLAKTVLEECFESGRSPGVIVQERGYVQISDASVVESAVEEAIRASPQAVSDYLKGKETAGKFIVGQVMKLTRGQAKPALVNELVKERLEAIRTS